MRTGSIIVISALLSFMTSACGLTTVRDLDGSGSPPSSGPDAAEVVTASFPAELTCGDKRSISLTFRNTGTSTWTKTAGFALRTVDDPDSIAFDTTLPLGDADVIAPGDAVTFEVAIRAPGTAGIRAPGWSMAHETSGLFGDTASASIQIGCNRTPDPAPGAALPLPDMSDLIGEISDADPTLLAESCQTDGGNWRFMDAVVDGLRKVDTRWGYNWKRGVVGDPSRDVVDYHYGAGDDEDSEQVYIIDILVDHCGTNAAPGWTDVTQATLDGGTIGIWTGRDRF